MKQAGTIYCKSNKENKVNENDMITRRKGTFISNPRELWPDGEKEFLYDKSQCTNATLKECNQTQLKSTSDYNDEYSNSNIIHPLLEDTIKNDGSLNDSLFDSLAKYENKKEPANAIINRLLSLQTLFREIKELIKM
jgi:hypothetical protein